MFNTHTECSSRCIPVGQAPSGTRSSPVHPRPARGSPGLEEHPCNSRAHPSPAPALPLPAHPQPEPGARHGPRTAWNNLNITPAPKGLREFSFRATQAALKAPKTPQSFTCPTQEPKPGVAAGTGAAERLRGPCSY